MPKAPAEQMDFLTGKYAALLASVELAIGSLLHALHIPFAGYALSLNQGFLLSRLTRESRQNSLAWQVTLSVGNIAATLKSFAPAGSKLGPMLSLSAQSFLYSAGLFLLGPNLFGACLGSILMAPWSFLQGFMTYYFLFGKNLFSALIVLAQKSVSPKFGTHQLLLVFVSLILLKVILATLLSLLAWHRRGDILLCSIENLSRKFKANQIENNKHERPLMLALKDLTRPLFLLSLFLSALFVFFTEHKLASLIWILLRPLGLGFILFYFSRTIPLSKWLSQAEGSRWQSLARSCRNSLEILGKIR